MISALRETLDSLPLRVFIITIHNHTGMDEWRRNPLNDIIQMLILIILGLLGITRLQAHKTKDLKKDIQQERETVKKREQQLEKLDEVQQKITTIEQEQPPETIEPPASGDTAGRLDRLNQLHKRANGKGE